MIRHPLLSLIILLAGVVLAACQPVLIPTPQPFPATDSLPIPTGSVPVEATSERTTAYIIIDQPQAGAQVQAGLPFVVSGSGAGLFEGNVVVQVLDSQLAVIFEQATILVGENVGLGGAGVWQVEVTLDNPVGPTLTIRAFSESPAPLEGSLALAEATVTVTLAAP